MLLPANRTIVMRIDDSEQPNRLRGIDEGEQGVNTDDRDKVKISHIQNHGDLFFAVMKYEKCDVHCLRTNSYQTLNKIQE